MARIKYYDSDTQQWVYGDMAVCLPSSRLPSAYQEVEYIESSGTQYIATNIKATLITTAFIKFNMTNTASADDGLFGSRVTGANGKFCVSVYQGNMYWHYASIQTANSITDGINSTILVNNNIIFNEQIINETTANTTINDTYPLYLFAWNNAGSPLVYGKFKCYSFIVSQGGVEVINLVPCYRKADGEIGMYDTVNGVFYTNSGSGTFSKGADV